MDRGGTASLPDSNSQLMVVLAVLLLVIQGLSNEREAFAWQINYASQILDGKARRRSKRRNTDARTTLDVHPRGPRFLKEEIAQEVDINRNGRDAQTTPRGRKRVREIEPIIWELFMMIISVVLASLRFTQEVVAYLREGVSKREK